MYLSKPGWGIVGSSLLVLVTCGCLIETDKQKFDRLKTGMSAAEVRDIIFPAGGGKYGHMRPDIRHNENLHLNNCMVLTVRNGVLVNKEWTGQERKKFVAQKR